MSAPTHTLGRRLRTIRCLRKESMINHDIWPDPIGPQRLNGRAAKRPPQFEAAAPATAPGNDDEAEPSDRPAPSHRPDTGATGPPVLG
jgi:hypothetical protein